VTPAVTGKQASAAASPSPAFVVSGDTSIVQSSSVESLLDSARVKHDLDLGEPASVGTFSAGASSFDAVGMGPSFAAAAPCAGPKR
jgi:hypothetical protein